MVKLRLALNKGSGSYSIIAAESKSRRYGKRIKIVGMYNPRLSEANGQRLFIDLDTVVKFISHGAQPTQRVAKLVKQFANKSSYSLPANVAKFLEEKASFVATTSKVESE